MGGAKERCVLRDGRSLSAFLSMTTISAINRFRHPEEPLRGVSKDARRRPRTGTVTMGVTPSLPSSYIGISS
jgi:hypothetical protein